MSLSDSNPQPDPLSLLDLGIFLENTHTLLPWGSTQEELIAILPPDSHRQTAAWEVLSWRSPVVLGGISGQELEISLAPADRFVEAWVWLERGEREQAARQAYQNACQQLNRLFHKPDRPPNDEPRGDEIDTWENQAVEIGLYLRTGLNFTDFTFSCHLSILTKKTIGSRPQADPDAPILDPEVNHDPI
jgi:hypothetical protein